MVSLRKQLQMFLKNLWIVIFLKTLSGLTFIFPSMGNWVKRLFFILSLYHELQRAHMVDNFTLSKLNDKLLMIREPTVLSKSMEIAQMRLTDINLDTCLDEGANIRDLLLQPTLTRPDAELIGLHLAKQTPQGLCYGVQAMSNDVVRILSQLKPVDPC